MNALSESEKLKWKQQLKAACLLILEQRITTAQQAMQHAQEAANSGDKSSAGDKYETSRAMGQLDRDMNAKQLEEAKRELGLINALNTTTLHTKVSTGTVVICQAYIFFIALGLGTTLIEDQKVILLSPKAPIALLLNQKQEGDTFTFNGKEIAILAAF